jgi:uncharacterized peroxidase-related enzyme
MAWIRTVSEEDANGRVAASYAAARQRAGRVYGIVRLMSPNPEVLDASMAFYMKLMKGPSPLSRRERELLAVVVSAANECRY